MNGNEMLMFYGFAALVSWIICGICCAAIGSSFWWGFWFGPVGIIIAAVRVNGNRRPQVVIVNGGARRRVRIARRGSVATPPPETEMQAFDRIFEAGQAAAAKRRQ